MASALATTGAAAFYREFLMARQAFQPRDFGIDMDKEDFLDLMADDFNSSVRGVMTVDELLLHPREALHFCDEVRAKHGYFSLPDDIILRSVMQRRKSPPGTRSGRSGKD
jgi:hypothetical protein